MNKAGCISFISGCGKPKYLLFKLLFSGKNLKVFFVCLFFPFVFYIELVVEAFVVTLGADCLLHVL